MNPEKANVSRRCLKRVLDRVLDDIEQAERCCTAQGRLRFANDPMRRDAAEQCLQRIRTAASTIARLDGVAHRALAPSFDVLGTPLAAASLDRMDSDVLFSLIELCRTQLRPDIAALVREPPRR